MDNYSGGGYITEPFSISRKVLFLDLHPEEPVDFPESVATQWDLQRLTDAELALEVLESNPCPVGMVQLDNLTARNYEQVQQLVNDTPGTNWIALLHRPSLEHPTIRKLIHDFFYDYHTLPLPEVENVSRLESTLGHAYGIELLDTPLATNTGKELECQMVGSSEAILDIFGQIRKISMTDAPVLITGESGTGKELIAQALHMRSDRAEGPFIPVNCGALPDTLIHSELFGHEKGAFTGAHRQNIGRIEAANNGTIFLDEIGDLPLDLQTYLLRFLQEKTIERLGSSHSHHVNARVIAATNVNLSEMVAENRFREDLYFRLNVLNIKVPALRDRVEDIPLLANYFFKRLKQESNSPAKGFSRNTLEYMVQYHWPGNVRELINRVRRALVMGEHKLITAEDLGLEEQLTPSLICTLEEVKSRAEKEMIQKGMIAAGNNITRAAQSLGVSRVTLYNLLNKHNIRR